MTPLPTHPAWPTWAPQVPGPEPRVLLAGGSNGLARPKQCVRVDAVCARLGTGHCSPLGLELPDAQPSGETWWPGRRRQLPGLQWVGEQAWGSFWGAKNWGVHEGGFASEPGEVPVRAPCGPWTGLEPLWLHTLVLLWGQWDSGPSWARAPSGSRNRS